MNLKKYKCFLQYYFSFNNNQTYKTLISVVKVISLEALYKLTRMLLSQGI